ncbi:beta-galactosidase GalB [Melioribacter sp. OK-6-Me]|uniref:beta-galactosidase GalB n=1 Tax=unclassified Melioribacter TaxID=2627329 RepID=UPI003ED906E9
MKSSVYKIALLALLLVSNFIFSESETENLKYVREKILLNNDWRFYKYEAIENADSLIYDIRPAIKEYKDDNPADAIPTEAAKIESPKSVLKFWILPTGNEFLYDNSKHYKRPDGNPGKDFPFVQLNYDDSNWEKINLPHDWAIKGPFLEGEDAEVGGGMGRLPIHGVAWYRKKIFIPHSDSAKQIYLDIDGAMSYAMVWINGYLAGGWPYGYNSFRINVTPYIDFGKDNIIAIRLDNPPKSSRWYPGAGIYRNVWLVKTNRIHIAHWGTFITTNYINKNRAEVDIRTKIDNNSNEKVYIDIIHEIYAVNRSGYKIDSLIASSVIRKVEIEPNTSHIDKSSIKINNPKLWGVPPTQTPNLYLSEIKLLKDGKLIDNYSTKFGIRKLEFNPEKGILLNDELIKIKGANLHHDLGPLGAAFNIRAAERQLELLREMGCNAIRFAHNPPAPEFLDLTDRMGFLVVDEIFDVWERKKTPLDFHLIFPEWHEQDLRAFVRRDRNHPSIIMWSFGNEVGEQYTDKEGAALAKHLYDIIKQEDSTRPATASMNYAKPYMPFPEVMDVISLNYQGEGIRNAPAYAHLQGIKTEPLYEEFHKKFPDKVILSSENAAALSSRGTYLFPVYDGISSPVSDSQGGDPDKKYVSAYELYTADFGSSADKVFATLDRHPFVAGGFVWSGWDYLGEPTPYYKARSSYFGVIDLAGFKKDRFYLYQSYWRPDYPMAHILPHWNWHDRVGKVTPVHIFTSGDEAELFLNGKSLGKKKKGKFEYRLRWDEVIYEPGELKVLTYKNGKPWATDSVKTTLQPAKVELIPDRRIIKADGKDLSFVTVKITDENGLLVPDAANTINLEIEGPAEIIATDNGDPTCMIPFPSKSRNAFNGLLLVIVRSIEGTKGNAILKAYSEGLQAGSTVISIE